MFDLALRAKGLASSNLNSLIALASNPAKMLKLLMAELEEAVIALARNAATLDRSAGKCTQDAEQLDAAAQTWEDKARLAMSHGREDLARGALAERNAAHDAAEAQRAAAATAHAVAADLRTSVTELEAKHGEARARLLKVLSEARTAMAVTGASKSRERTGTLRERFASLEKQIDYTASHAAAPASLDQELAALANDATLEADLAALRKGAAKKRK